jgi:hypothetical protein
MHNIYYTTILEHELFTLRKHMGSPRFLDEVRVAHLCSVVFFACVFYFIWGCLSSFYVCLISPESMNCPLMIAPAVLSNVYLI